MSEPDMGNRVKILTLHLPLPVSTLSYIGRLGDLYESCVMIPVDDGSADGMTGTVEVWAGPEKNAQEQDLAIARMSMEHNQRNRAPSFVCPSCGAESFNTHDIINQYCGSCHEFFGEEERG